MREEENKLKWLFINNNNNNNAKNDMEYNALTIAPTSINQHKFSRQRNHVYGTQNWIGITGLKTIRNGYTDVEPVGEE